MKKRVIKKITKKRDENPLKELSEREKGITTAQKMEFLWAAHEGHAGVSAMHLALQGVELVAKKEDIHRCVQACRIFPRKKTN